jgi:aminoglycoside phosphotransferase (APT) family kinase protein
MAVVRRPPQGELLPKAHDMGREWAIISALGLTPVPVARAIAFCEDPSVTGIHFYVMGLIDGQPLYTADDTEGLIPLALRERCAHSFIDVLASLHSVDPDAVGLSDLGKKDGYVGRQLKTWYRSWTSSIEGAQFNDERAHRLQQFFLDHLRVQGPARVVHGDYGTHNCLFGADCRIAAVVDWEISTLADLGYALNQWTEPAEPIGPRGQRPTQLLGFPSRAALARRYAQQTGRDLSRLDYYIGFNHWKSACTVHCVYARYLEGKKSTAGVDLIGLRASVLRSLDAADEAVRRLQA